MAWAVAVVLFLLSLFALLLAVLFLIFSDCNSEKGARTEIRREAVLFLTFQADPDIDVEGYLDGVRQDLLRLCAEHGVRVKSFRVRERTNNKSHRSHTLSLNLDLPVASEAAFADAFLRFECKQADGITADMSWLNVEETSTSGGVMRHRERRWEK